ncbi:MAG: cytochrome b [Ahniella sp.]|nr:cytochrome b [Ahniella sp.]
MSEVRGYSLYARMQHVLMALVVLGTLGLGAFMADIEPLSRRFQAFGWHKSLGLLVLALWIVRVLWRLRARVPALPTAMPGWQQRAAQVSHVLLYGLMLVVPVSGWLYHSSTNLPLRWFGLFRVPALMDANPGLKDTLKDLHGILAWTLLALIILHIGAALKHHFLDRDDVFRRMFRSIS